MKHFSKVHLISSLLVVHFVDADGHVLGITATRVHGPIVLGHEINVMKAVTIIAVLVEGVDETSIHNDRFVECATTALK